MLRIQSSVWREEFIYMIEIDEDDPNVVNVFSTNDDDIFEYRFGDADEAKKAFEAAVCQWEAGLIDFHRRSK